jgi:hypothetical protein
MSKTALCIERPWSLSCAREEAGGGTQLGGSQRSSGWCSQGPWPGEDGAHMGGCFCIPRERSLSWDPGEFSGGLCPDGLAKLAGPGKAQVASGLGKLPFQS